MSTEAGKISTPTPTPPWPRTVAVVAAWFALWFLAPGLTSRGIGSQLGLEWGEAVLVESAVVVVLALVLMALQRKRTAQMFARSRWMLAYLAPLVLAAVLPLHYGMDMPVVTYILWWCASVFWQGLLTFGLLQSHLRDRLSPKWTIIAVAVIFYLGHAVFLPGAFSPVNPLAALAIFALGLVFAVLRHATGTLHLILALHLSFYFIAV